jgi:2-phosphoglycolate phosphatase
MPYRAVLFDFDGTLADSFAAITASTNYVRNCYGLQPLPERAIREYVGYGLPHLMEQLVPCAALAEAVDRYREHHPSVMRAGTRLMPGVAETVATLHQRNFRMGVCSNKQVAFTKQLMDSLGLAKVMQTILGPEDVGGRAKPDPAMLLVAMDQMGISRGEAVYVGDMAIDVHTGQAAGVAVWLVRGGAAGQESAEAAGPDRVLDHFSDLLDLLPGVL